MSEQVQVTPSRGCLSPFLKSNQHVALDQRLGQLDDRDVRLLLLMAWVHPPAPISYRALKFPFAPSGLARLTWPKGS